MDNLFKEGDEDDDREKDEEEEVKGEGGRQMEEKQEMVSITDRQP